MYVIFYVLSKMVGNLHKVSLKFFLKILKITWPSSASYSFVLVFWSRDGSLPTARKIYIAIARRLRGVLNKKGDVLIGNVKEDIKDDLTYDEMIYLSGDSVSIDEIVGVEYDPEPVEKIKIMIMMKHH